MEENFLRGIEHPSKRERLFTSHMELETTKAVLMAQDLSKAQNIIITHLSDRNSNEARFVDEIKAIIGKQVYAAKTGLSIDLTPKPFLIMKHKRPQGDLQKRSPINISFKYDRFRKMQAAVIGTARNQAVG